MLREEVSVEELRRAKGLFNSALAEPPGKAGAEGNQADPDPRLGSLLERMLRADSQPHSVLDRPLSLSAGLTVADEFEPGCRVGTYTVVRQLGSGGMGTVYLVEIAGRSEGAQFALKVLRWSSPELLRRFERERAILTSAQHPNVARLIDAGITEQRSPYLVMEYVEGEAITSHCKTRNLTTSERIKLLRQLCAALRYLHQNLIVHRDLKPGNVLVTGNGVVKLVDFGIAKLLQVQDASAPPDTTLHLMTPDYASPEQVRGLSVTTLSDVYGAGILFYEVLTGVNPFTTRTRDMHETLRAICEEEPERPSAAVLHSPRPPVEAQSISRQLRGELDNIILKATRKEPERRYASIEKLDEDLERYLTCRPVLAQGDSLSYRVHKFVQRQKVLVSLSTLLLIVLMAAVFVTSFEARIARQERARAEAHALSAENARAIAETQTRIADEQRQRAELASSEAERQRVTAERRLAELEQTARGAAQLYAHSRGEQGQNPDLIADNTRDVLLRLQRERPLDPALARLLGTMPSRGSSPLDRAWHVPSGWWAGETNASEYFVGIDTSMAHSGQNSLIVRSQESKPLGMVSVAQTFGSTRYQGKRIRVSAYLKPAQITRQGLLWVTVSKSGTPTSTFEYVNISGTHDWRRYDVVVDIPAGMDSISIGVQLQGPGTLRADDFNVESVDSTVPLTHINLPGNLDFRK